MLTQDNGKGHVIIGEAALHLALADKEIDIVSLIAELGQMAANVFSGERLSDISEARSWLKKYANHGPAEQPVPFLQIFEDLNEEIY